MKIWITDDSMGLVTRARDQQSFYAIPADDLPKDMIESMLKLDRLFIEQAKYLEQLKYIYGTRSKVERPEPTGEYKEWLDGEAAGGSKQERKATVAPSNSKSQKRRKQVQEKTSASTTKPTP